MMIMMMVMMMIMIMMMMNYIYDVLYPVCSVNVNSKDIQYVRHKVEFGMAQFLKPPTVVAE